MGFCNVLGHRDHNSFPTDHGAATQCKRDRYLHPGRNKVRGCIQTARELLERGGIRWVGYRMRFHQLRNGVVSEVNVGPNPGSDSFTQLPERLLALQVSLESFKGYYKRSKRSVLQPTRGFSRTT